MLEFGIPRPRNRPLRILCLGAHCDDIEIGCGGTILKIAGKGRPVHVTWVVFASTPVRGREAHASAREFTRRAPGSQIIVKDFRDGFLPYTGGDVKDFFEELKDAVDPDLIFTHYRFDLHQDHRLICELTWNTFRHHLILEYEVPKYDGDLGQPNVFVPLDATTSRRKVRLILKHFQSQRSKHWLTENTLVSLLSLRAVESGSRAKYAEAFYCRKLLL